SVGGVHVVGAGQLDFGQRCAGVGVGVGEGVAGGTAPPFTVDQHPVETCVRGGLLIYHGHSALLLGCSLLRAYPERELDQTIRARGRWRHRCSPGSGRGLTPRLPARSSTAGSLRWER